MNITYDKQGRMQYHSKLHDQHNEVGAKMELTLDDIIALVKEYGREKWSSTAQGLIDTTTLGHYNFTTRDFSEWHQNACVLQGSSLWPPLSFLEINYALKHHPECQKVCSSFDPNTSWLWRLHLQP